jgi:hypothetical protein
MPWQQLSFSPGIVKDRTRYSASPYWYDGSLVRFRQGLPESWGGWVGAYPTLNFDGVCRSLLRFSDLSGFRWTGIGTNSLFYVASDDVSYEVTPVGQQITLGTNPIATTNGSDVVTITHTDHLKFPGQWVVFSGATATGGLTISGKYIIASFVDDDHYTIKAASNATSTATGGGSAVVAKYLYYAGSVGQVVGGGWGSGGWGLEEWGGDPTTTSSDHMGIWSQDNWGEDLTANPSGGPIFYWDATNPENRMVDILDLAGADGNAPSFAQFIIVSHRDRHILAFGAEEFSTGANATMSFRWCSQEDILNWNEADTTGTAGSLPLSRGSRFISGIATKREIVAWSDQAIYSITYVGDPYIYTADMIAGSSDILGLKACTLYNGTVFWIGRSGIYAYDGSITHLDCPVWDYVVAHIDFSQSQKTFAATNAQFSEIIFFYQSTDSTEIDSYISFNVAEKVWTNGQLSRTCWIDGDQLAQPLAASTDGYLYLHEVGASDGSASPATMLDSYIESAPFELSSEGSYDKGDKMMFVRRMLPDITFRDYADGINTPKVDFVIKMTDKPGDNFDQTSSSQVSRSVIVPVEQFTDDVFVRIRGRSFTLRIETKEAGTLLRMGVPRIDARTDGQR